MAGVCVYAEVYGTSSKHAETHLIRSPMSLSRKLLAVKLVMAADRLSDGAVGSKGSATVVLAWLLHRSYKTHHHHHHHHTTIVRHDDYYESHHLH